jgi:hypothetical protein
MTSDVAMPIPRRWSSHSQAKGDWRMDPEGQWVIWADVAEVIEWAGSGGLDVERLATAIHVVSNHAAPDNRGDRFPHPHPLSLSTVEQARAVAAEYARLASTEPVR